MSARDTVRFLAPDALTSLRRARRYAVPRWMIEESAARRAADDWQGACAAAGFDVDFDPAGVAARDGADVARALGDDLRHLVPDLLRWHLPRILGGRSTLATDLTMVLAGYGRAADGPGATAPYLHLRTPPMADGPQRISLRFGPVRHRGAAETPPGVFSGGVEDWRGLRHLWDARRAGELRARAGGADRLPFLHADGTPRPAAALPREDPGAEDAVARAEWITLLFRDGQVAAALAAAGIAWDPTPPDMPAWYRASPEQIMTGQALDIPRLEAEVRRFAGASTAERFQIGVDWRARILLEFTRRGRLKVAVVSREAAEGAAFLPEAVWRRPPDLDLLREGGVTPAALHPLVAGALFPGLDGPFGPPGPTPPAPVRVRCRGGWHDVVFRDGTLASPHSEQERQRENALRAFGGAVTGCFAVEHACTSGTGRLPRALAAQRRELFLRAQHGDTPGVLELLDAGFDPHIRDGGRRGLLHVLPLLDHRVLLPRLLAAGLDLEARDCLHRTPLSTAVSGRGSAALVRALVDAGARTDVVDHMELSLAQVIRKYRRSDLEFLGARVRKEHPGIGADWWEEWEDDQEGEEE